MDRQHQFYIFFFFNDTATTEIYTLSLHDALPISARQAAIPLVVPAGQVGKAKPMAPANILVAATIAFALPRSEEHTSELQSHLNLVCRLLLEKKKRDHFVKIEYSIKTAAFIDVHV